MRTEGTEDTENNVQMSQCADVRMLLEVGGWMLLERTLQANRAFLYADYLAPEGPKLGSKS